MTAEVVSISPRALPHNLEAEQALLGAILFENRVLDRMPDLAAEHFYFGPHQRIFAAISDLTERGQRADPVTLKAKFAPDELADIGGQEYLASLAAGIVSLRDAAFYAETIREFYVKRELISIGQALSDAALEPRPTEGVDDLIAATESELARLTDGEFKPTGAHVATAYDAALARVDEAYRTGTPPGFDTGFAGIRNLIGGLKPGQLTVIAARPSMGKSALARCIADNISRNGAPVAYFDLENDAGSFALALASRRLRLPYTALNEASGLTQDDFDRLTAFRQELAKQPLTIDDRAGVGVSYIRSRCRRIKRRGGLSVAVIDYLQLMRPSGRYDGKRVLEIGEITQSLKALAKELDIAVLLLSQLNRGVESRENKRPMLADLRDSGTIEQDADTVMFVYREEYYLRRDRPSDDDKMDEWTKKMLAVAGKAEVIVAKQRHGPTGNGVLSFDETHVSFGDMQTGGYE